MRTTRRKPRYHSDPLPLRSDSESPSLEDGEERDPSLLTRQPPKSTQVALPPTPISAGGATTRRVIERYPASHHREARQSQRDQHYSNMNRPPYSAHPSNQQDTPITSSNTLTSPPSSSSSPVPATMPQRVDVQSNSRGIYEGRYPHTYSNHTASPPMTALPHSPSISSENSSVSSPAPTTLPSIFHPSYSSPTHNYSPHQTYGGHYSQDQYPNHSSYASDHSPRYTHQSSVPISPRSNDPTQYSSGPSYQHGQSFQTPVTVWTTDASTKLSDRVRRRCFNCCTTDTSTWRRSSLHPGKVLCNKCGLFERTHSRPRPHEFPHKRGPMTTFKSGSPPHSRPPSESDRPTSQGPSQSPLHNLPPPPSHPSLSNVYSSQGNTLPQIQDWRRTPGRERLLYSPTHPASTIPPPSSLSSASRSPPRREGHSSSSYLPPPHSRSPGPQAGSSRPGSGNKHDTQAND